MNRHAPSPYWEIYRDGELAEAVLGANLSKGDFTGMWVAASIADDLEQSGTAWFERSRSE